MIRERTAVAVGRVAPEPSPGARRVAVFALDPDLLQGVPARAAQTLALRAWAPAVAIPAGAWTPTGSEPAEGLGYLVLDGLLVRNTFLGQRPAVELLGHGDLLKPWLETQAASPPGIGWRAETPVLLARLDEGFERVALRLAPVVRHLLERSMLRSRRLAAQNALATVTPIDRRVLLGLRQVADRWGRVTPQGVLIPFPLSHRLIAEIVGATRPTVSSVLSDLRRAGLAERVDEGWLLHEPG